MARNTTLNLTAETWTELTGGDVASLTFQNKGGHHILVKGGATAALPTDADGALRYNPGQGERNARLSDLFPGLAAVRVFAYCDFGVPVVVSHA